MMGEIVKFPHPTSPVEIDDDGGEDETRVMLHCSNCGSAHFVIEVINQGERVIRCGLGFCDQVIEDFFWTEGR